MSSPMSVAARDIALRIEVGGTRLPAETHRALVRGSLLGLAQAVSDPVEVFAGGRLVARGELLVREDRFCVRVTEVHRHGPAS